MDAPPQFRTAAAEGEDVSITRREYEDGSEVTVDFGADVDLSLDLVGDVAILVAGDRQYEFEVPDDATDLTTNDGMLIIRE